MSHFEIFIDVFEISAVSVWPRR